MFLLAICQQTVNSHNTICQLVHSYKRQFKRCYFCLHDQPEKRRSKIKSQLLTLIPHKLNEQTHGQNSYNAALVKLAATAIVKLATCDSLAV